MTDIPAPVLAYLRRLDNCNDPATAEHAIAHIRYREALLSLGDEEPAPAPPVDPYPDDPMWFAWAEEHKLASRSRWGDGLLTEITDLGRAELALADQPAPTPPRPSPEYLGNGKLRVGDIVLSLTLREAEVLEGLLKLKAASGPELKETSGHDDADKVLRGIGKKHPDLAVHIRTPNGKKGVGYGTTIVDARPAK